MNGTCLGCSAGYKGATCESGMYLFLTIHYNSLNNQIDASFIRLLKQCVFLKEKKNTENLREFEKKRVYELHQKSIHGHMERVVSALGTKE